MAASTCGAACPTPSPRPPISCAASAGSRPAGRRGSVPAAGLSARSGRHHGREAGARLGADGREEGGRRGLPSSDEPSSIILPAGFRGPAFILYPNFKAVMNWNRSTLYALSVAILASRSPAAAGHAGPPADDEPLSRNTVIDMQNRLARLTLYTDEIDGLLGPRRARRCGSTRSRSACRPTAIRRPSSSPPAAGGTIDAAGGR